MLLRRILLRESYLYVILDQAVCPKGRLLEIARRVSDSGVRVIQFRDKVSPVSSVLGTAQALKKLISSRKTMLIINDYLEVAKIIDSDGVHLGQEDASPEIARAVLGADKIIGVSCHSLTQASIAVAQGADYLGIGPKFFTPTKPHAKPVGTDLIRRINAKIGIPFFAIGGINAYNLDALKAQGAKRVAVCAAVCRAKDINKALNNLQKKLQHN